MISTIKQFTDDDEIEANRDIDPNALDDDEEYWSKRLNEEVEEAEKDN